MTAGVESLIIKVFAMNHDFDCEIIIFTNLFRVLHTFLVFIS